MHVYYKCILKNMHVSIYAPPAQVAQGDTTTCASGLSALVAEWKSTTSTNCNWQQPPPVQVECLHQLKEGKHLKHKVQRSACKVQSSGHKVQRSGPASVLVSTGCSNNMKLQSPPHLTMQLWPAQHDAAISATCVRAHHWLYNPSHHASCTDCCIMLCWSYLPRVSTLTEVRQYALSLFSPKMFIQQQIVAKFILPQFSVRPRCVMSRKGNGLSTLQLVSVAYISRMILTMKPGKKEKESRKERIGCWNPVCHRRSLSASPNAYTQL